MWSIRRAKDQSWSSNVDLRTEHGVRESDRDFELRKDYGVREIKRNLWLHNEYDVRNINDDFGRDDV